MDRIASWFSVPSNGSTYTVPLRTQPSRTVFMKQSSPWQLAQFCLSAAHPMCTATSPLRYGFSASQARRCVAIGFCNACATRRLIQ